VITGEEAGLFGAVHDAMDELLKDGAPRAGGGMGPVRLKVLAELVEAREITQAGADAFNDIHDRLVEAGLIHEVALKSNDQF
jgi:hypothetical protein